ncbi:D-glycero-alpha-D-manno-heptose-1,7-bisphosphate 7-phosphatase [Desulfovibrio sp. TomC]|uniref:D-glycero-alpha-D-manno-heptose-1,7-bisphosphate 7-phosphatase n=1 Tax=Desulfovibrio sp. TomC TaxID=1562888 RepID=UPI00057457C6|nr:HAD family hydrolase [Desulfovibrio sp. TomC]KHK00733.1 D-glycero-D-manno-heptose 1,7-bisphosphate phosphatase [Desulfovibrio sp. TomC]
MPAAIRHILLDRDGTVIVDRHYLARPDGVELLPGAGQALARLARTGADLYLVTNQSGIGRGYYAEADFQAVQTRLLELLTPYGAPITSTAHCPHAPGSGCDCRKPAPGLFTRLAAAYGLDPAATAVIGDKACDVAFGLALGAPLTILVTTGHGQRAAHALGLPPLVDPWLELADRKPDWPHVLARDLAAAADFLLAGRLALHAAPKAAP